MQASKTKKVNDAKSKETLQVKKDLHPLEAKFGLEPKIEPTEKWHWH